MHSVVQKNMISGLKRGICLSIGCVCLFSIISSSWAGPAYVELSESRLATIRGKYTVGNEIVFFGLTLSTEWSAPGQTPHEVRMKFAMDHSGPDAKYQLSYGGTLGAQVDADEIKTESGGLNQVDGAVLAIQVGGESNIVLNRTNYRVIESSQHVPKLSQGQSQLGGSVKTYQNQDKVTQIHHNGSIGYVIQSGKNQVVQRLGNHLGSDSKQMLQSVQLSGHNQKIVNDLNLTVAFDKDSQVQRSTLRLLTLPDVLNY